MGWRFIQLIMRPRIRLNGQRYNDDPNGRNSRAPWGPAVWFGRLAEGPFFRNKRGETIQNICFIIELLSLGHLTKKMFGCYKTPQSVCWCRKLPACRSVRPVFCKCPPSSIPTTSIDCVGRIARRWLRKRNYSGVRACLCGNGYCKGIKFACKVSELAFLKDYLKWMQ